MSVSCRLVVTVALSMSLLASCDAKDVSTMTSRADPTDMKRVAQGRTLYATWCAGCHGINLQGQPDWRKRKADGRLPPPPHDETGHTWHHSDQMLFDIVKDGLEPPFAPAGYRSDMRGYGSVLSDEEIWAVLAYIKSRWPPEVTALRKEMLHQESGNRWQGNSNER